MAPTGKRYPPRPQEPVSNRLVCQALCQGPLDTSVTAVTGAVARKGKAHIAVRYGRVLLYIEDRAALEALVGAVDRANNLAEAVFGPADEAAEATRQAAIKLFERTGKVPFRPV